MVSAHVFNEVVYENNFTKEEEKYMLSMKLNVRKFFARRFFLFKKFSQGI